MSASLEEYRSPRTLVQIARCMALAKLHELEPAQVAEELYGNTRHKRVADILTRSAVDTHVSTSGSTGAELFSPSDVAANFARAVDQLTALGRLQTTRVPMNTFLPFVSGKTTPAFVGQDSPIPASAPTFGGETHLGRKKIASIVVVSKELLQHSQAEDILQREMISALVEGHDAYLLDRGAETAARPPAINADAYVDTPYFYTQIGALTNLRQIDELASAMIGELVAKGMNMASAAFVTSPANCLGLGLMRNGSVDSGARAFPGINVRGGELAGLPLIAAAGAPASGLTLVDASQIQMASEAVEISITDKAFIDQDDAPAGNTHISLFQADAVGIKVLRYVNWRLIRDAVSFANFQIPLATPSTT